jgi:hypothetical protein
MYSLVLYLIHTYYLTRVIILDRPWQPYPLGEQLEAARIINNNSATTGIVRSNSRVGFMCLIFIEVKVGDHF